MKISILLGSTSALMITILASSYGQNTTAQEQNPAAAANMTKANFNTVRDNLITARLGILNNDSISAYNAINTAGSELFGLARNGAGDNETLAQQLSKELRQVQYNIDNTRDALRDTNSTQALRSLNVADVKLLLITQDLPPGEEVEEAETEE